MTLMERSVPIDGRTIEVAMDYTRLWEGFHERVGSDGTGVPTVGHGFALVVKVGNKWKLNEENPGELANKLGRFGVDLDSDDLKKLNEIARALDADNSTLAESLIEGHVFPSITPAEADRLLRETITEKAEMVRDRIGEDTFASLSPERQSVLIDFAYQREGRMRNIAPAVGAHLAVGDFEAAAKVLEGIGGGVPKRLNDNIAYFRAPYAPGVVRAQPGDGLEAIAKRYRMLNEDGTIDETATIRRLNPHIDFDDIGERGVGAGQFVRIVPAAPHADLGGKLKEQNMKKTEAPSPGPRGGLLGEMGVGMAELSYEARRMLGNRLGFDPLDERRVAANREKVEATAEDAFLRNPGFDDLPRPSVRRILTPELDEAVRRAEGAGRLGRVSEEFALRAFQDFAARAATDDRLPRRLDGALRRTLGLAFGGKSGAGGRPEVRALQALHNDLPYVTHGRYAPLAVDGVAGRETRRGFVRTLESIGLERMARGMAERLRRD